MSGGGLQKRLIFAVALSLLTSENSLFRLQQFRVPLRREFDCNRLNFPANRKGRLLPGVRIFKIPCYFPCYQGIWMLRRVRSGLHPPPRTPALNEISCCLPNTRDFARASPNCPALIGGAVSAIGRPRMLSVARLAPAQATDSRY